MTLNEVRNGWTYTDVPNTFFAGGDGDLMNAHANGTEDSGYIFDMDVSNIPYPSYDLIVYLSANEAQFGDGTGKVVLNGGAEQGFTLPAGQFSGFVEITNATTPGNYIVFRDLTNPSQNLKVWGNGFNHIGPSGFQIVNYGALTGDTLPPVISSLNPENNATGVSVGANLVVTFGENIVHRHRQHHAQEPERTRRRRPSPSPTPPRSRISGSTLTINPTANLQTSKNYAIQIARDRDQGPGQTTVFAGITNDTTWNFTTSATTAIPGIVCMARCERRM